MTLRAALVTPLSGPLAGYGRAGAQALELWNDWWCGAAVSLTVHDANPDPAAAVRRAEDDGFDLLFGAYGSSPAREVARATARPVWNHGGARTPDADHVVSVLAPASSYFDGAVAAVHRAEPGLRRVVVVHGDTGFGRAVGEGAARAASRRGLPVHRLLLPAPAPPPDPPPDDSKVALLPSDGSKATMLRRDRVPEDGLLLVAGGFDAERAAAVRLLPGRWRAAGFVGAGVDEVLAGIGVRREGLLGPAQWLHPRGPVATPAEPDEGPSAAEFAAEFRRRTGTEPPYPAAQAFAAGIVAARCARDVGDLDGSAARTGRVDGTDSALLAAARRLDCTTLLGRFRLDPATGRQTGLQVLTVQWQDGERVVVWPPERAQAPLHHPL